MLIDVLGIFFANCRIGSLLTNFEVKDNCYASSHCIVAKLFEDCVSVSTLCNLSSGTTSFATGVAICCCGQDFATGR